MTALVSYHSGRLGYSSRKPSDKVFSLISFSRFSRSRCSQFSIPSRFAIITSENIDKLPKFKKEVSYETALMSR